MARSLKTVNEIHNYVSMVTAAANHHASSVASIIPYIESAVLMRLNLSNDDVSIYERNGKLARTCWVKFGGPPARRWVFSYNYNQQKIDLRKGSIQGNVIFQFDNSTPISVINAQIANL